MSDQDIDSLVSQVVSPSPKECKTICKGDRECSGWCAPLYIHIILSCLQLLAILMMKKYNPRKREYVPESWGVKLRYALISVCWNVMMGIIMFYLCKYCHSGWAWVLLLLPIIINSLVLLALVIAIIYIAAHRKPSPSNHGIGPMQCKRNDTGLYCSDVGYCCNDAQPCCPERACEGGVCVATHN